MTKARNATKRFPKQKRHKMHKVNEDDSETKSGAEQHFFFFFLFAFLSDMIKYTSTSILDIFQICALIL